MSSLTFTEARDEIMAVFKAAWDPTGLPALYDDTPGDVPSSGAWARVNLRHNPVGGRVTLTSDVGTRSFRRNGRVIIQVFTPPGDGLSLADSLGKILVDAFDGVATPGNVIFRNAAFHEVGPSGDHFQCNVTASFEYEEVK